MTYTYDGKHVLKDGEVFWPLAPTHIDREPIEEVLETVNGWEFVMAHKGMTGRKTREAEVWLRGLLAGGHKMGDSHLELFRGGKVHPVCG